MGNAEKLRTIMAENRRKEEEENDDLIEDLGEQEIDFSYGTTRKHKRIDNVETPYVKETKDIIETKDTRSNKYNVEYEETIESKKLVKIPKNKQSIIHTRLHPVIHSKFRMKTFAEKRTMQNVVHKLVELYVWMESMDTIESKKMEYTLKMVDGKLAIHEWIGDSEDPSRALNLFSKQIFDFPEYLS